MVKIVDELMADLKQCKKILVLPFEKTKKEERGCFFLHTFKLHKDKEFGVQWMMAYPGNYFITEHTIKKHLGLDTTKALNNLYDSMLELGAVEEESFDAKCIIVDVEGHKNG